MVGNRSVLAPQLPSPQKVLYHADTWIELTTLQLCGRIGQVLSRMPTPKCRLTCRQQWSHGRPEATCAGRRGAGQGCFNRGYGQICRWRTKVRKAERVASTRVQRRGFVSTLLSSYQMRTDGGHSRGPIDVSLQRGLMAEVLGQQGRLPKPEGMPNAHYSGMNNNKKNDPVPWSLVLDYRFQEILCKSRY